MGPTVVHGGNSKFYAKLTSNPFEGIYPISYWSASVLLVGLREIEQLATSSAKRCENLLPSG